MAAKLQPIQKMETESEVLVTGEGGKITTITQVENTFTQVRCVFCCHLLPHHHNRNLKSQINQISKYHYNQAQLAGAVPMQTLS